MLDLNALIGDLNHAVNQEKPERAVESVKAVLRNAAKSGIDLPKHCFQSCTDHYARHLLHAAPNRSYSAVVMVWGPGQGTPLHDHGKLWCVECVLTGEIAVTQFEHLGESSPKRHRFKAQETVIAQPGEAGHLIPPFDYHTISNPTTDKTATTLHVYGGDYQECAVFIPEGDGTYREELKRLTFD